MDEVGERRENSRWADQIAERLITEAASQDLAPNITFRRCVEESAQILPLPIEAGHDSCERWIQRAVTISREAWSDIADAEALRLSNLDLDPEILKSVDSTYDVYQPPEFPPYRVPKSAEYVYTMDGPWSPVGGGWDRYYVSLDRTRRRWMLWLVSGNLVDREDSNTAWMPRQGLSSRKAAEYMLVKQYRVWRGLFDDMDEPPTNSSASMDPIVQAIWPELRPELRFDLDRAIQIASATLQDRLGSAFRLKE